MKPLLGYRHGDRNSNKIALTFDDGPSLHTRNVLVILKKYHVKATFFLIGKHIEQLPDVAREILESGHEVGNHTYSHQEVTWFKRLFGFFPEDEVLKTQEVIKNLLGVYTKLFRPLKSFALHRCYRKFVARHDLVPILASAYSRARRPAQRQLKDVTGKLRGGDIILLHDRHDVDIQSNKWSRKTVEILPDLIEYARKKDLQFVTVSELLKRN